MNSSKLPGSGFDVRSELSALPTQPFEEWKARWRFDDIPLNRIHKEQIVPFAPGSARRLNDLIADACIHDEVPFAPGIFKRCESLVLRNVEINSQDSVVRKWLYRRGIPFQHPIVLSWDGDTACRTTWKILIKHWAEFFLPSSDDVTVFDGTLRWALLYYHEEELHFGSNIPPRRSTS